MAANTTVSGSVFCMKQAAWLGGPAYRGFLHYNRLIFLSILGMPVCVVGIFTSGLSISLFSRDKTTPRTTRKLLIVTSAADVQFLLFSLLYLQPLTFCGRGCRLRWIFRSNPYVLFIFSFVNILECFRNWLVVLIGVERFLVICHPVRSKVWWNGRLTNHLIIASFGFAILARLPLIFYLAFEEAGREWSRVAL
ncbi:unnamed protein product, partial [Dibothriocephalus latus]